ncbi:hypothetical protein PCIT_a2933 [Pseudoalteromonas citrea]|uniref:Gp5/Type VI secretion system Vgr protein OB-fold domain-containing protein n=2 Tax=Pseudoalteromonas citrea TaxID=43655 RepID=A0AAD4AHY4_9GAMM|nr:phage baseplate assembly protein V [Pseudoalteromonas citrea]KAF7769999.1 hypothetical protein PCIT_a2933 [Pseudoalteromonas citrea]
MIANPLQTNLAQADMQHRLAKLISLGTVNEVDYEKALVRVTIGDWLTSWLPWLTAQAFNDLTWQAPEVGEQVVVLAPCGDLAQGVVLGSLYQKGQNLEKVANDVAKESRQHVQRTKYKDGSMVEYDREKHRYFIDIKGEGATVDVVSAGTLNITTEQDITIHTKTSATVNVDKDATIAVKGNAKITADKQIDVAAKDKLSLSGSEVKIESKSGGIAVKAAAVLKLNGSKISAQE